MALVLADRVQETGTANTTVSFTLAGAVPGYQSFSSVGNGNTTFYSATDASGGWEVGLGTYSTTGPTLTRTTVYSSSNSGSAVTFSGTVTVFLTYPSGRSVNLDASGNVSALGTIASGTWQGSTVGVAYGGTGVTASSGANSVMLRDANQNVAVNRLNQSNQNTTAAAGTTTLTAASSYSQTLNGTGGQTYKMPDATTLTTGVAFVFNNNATGTLTLQDYASGAIGTITSGGAVELVLLANGTVAGTWDVHGYIPENVTWGTNALALGSTVITGGTWQGGAIGTAYGGTGLSGATPFTSGGAVYANSASTLTSGTLPISAGGTGSTSTTYCSLTTNVTGTLPITNGGTGNTSGQAASVANALTAGTGLSLSSGTTYDGSAAKTINLANTAVSAGSYTYASITVDAQGRLTSASSGASPSAFPSGTRMMFAQTAAPTGWTKDTVNYNNHSLRVVTGTAGTGGTVDFTTAFASQAVSGTIANTTATGSISTSTSVSLSASGSVSATTLAESQIPSHVHSVPGNTSNSSGSPFRILSNTNSVTNVTNNTNATGGSGSHTHGFTDPSYSASSSSSFTGTAHNHTFTGTAINLAVKYLDVITATKD